MHGTVARLGVVAFWRSIPSPGQSSSATAFAFKCRQAAASRRSGSKPKSKKHSECPTVWFSGLNLSRSRMLRPPLVRRSLYDAPAGSDPAGHTDLVPTPPISGHSPSTGSRKVRGARRYWVQNSPPIPTVHPAPRSRGGRGRRRLERRRGGRHDRVAPRADQTRAGARLFAHAVTPGVGRGACSSRTWSPCPCRRPCGACRRPGFRGGPPGSAGCST